MLNDGVTVTVMSTSKRPSLLSQTRTESGVAVAIRSPCGEYLAAVTESPWASVCTRSRVAMSQMVDAETSRAESGEKSTPMTSWKSSLCEMTFLYVFASHTITSPQRVPAAIHRPSLDTARHWTRSASIVAICLPSPTRHTRISSTSSSSDSSPLKRYLPFAENVTACNQLPTLISIAGCSLPKDQHQRALHLSVRTRHCRRRSLLATQSSSAMVGVGEQCPIVRIFYTLAFINMDSPTTLRPGKRDQSEIARCSMRQTW